MALLEEIKLLKGIQDNVQDDLLILIISESEQRILGYINSIRSEPMDVLPDELDYIVRDVSIKRFNKIDSEGTVKDSEEGRSLDWEKSYLDEYTHILNQYTDTDESGQYRHGTVRFI